MRRRRRRSKCRDGLTQRERVERFSLFSIDSIESGLTLIAEGRGKMETKNTNTNKNWISLGMRRVGYTYRLMSGMWAGWMERVEYGFKTEIAATAWVVAEARAAGY